MQTRRATVHLGRQHRHTAVPPVVKQSCSRRACVCVHTLMLSCWSWPLCDHDLQPSAGPAWGNAVLGMQAPHRVLRSERTSSVEGRIWILPAPQRAGVPPRRAARVGSEQRADALSHLKTPSMAWCNTSALGSVGKHARMLLSKPQMPAALAFRVEPQVCCQGCESSMLLSTTEWMDYIYPAARANEVEADASLRSIIKGTKHMTQTHDVMWQPHNVMLPHEQQVCTRQGIDSAHTAQGTQRQGASHHEGAQSACSTAEPRYAGPTHLAMSGPPS